MTLQLLVSLDTFGQSPTEVLCRYYNTKHVHHLFQSNVIKSNQIQSILRNHQIYILWQSATYNRTTPSSFDFIEGLDQL